jgi:uncharacterized protein (TIGR03435 family)
LSSPLSGRYNGQAMRAIVLVSAAGVLLAQPSERARFEVASVKPAAPRTTGRGEKGGPGTSDPGQIVFNDFTLRALIFRAYDIRPFQLNAPSWIDDAHFDIAAKVPAGAKAEDVRPMLRSLLEERFRLQVRRESRPTDAYALTVGKGGAKMTVYPLDLPDDVTEALPKAIAGLDKSGLPIVPHGYATGMMGMSEGRRWIVISRQPISALSSFLSRVVGVPVVDQTGLTGRYDVRLTFAADARPETDPPEGTPTASDPAPTVFQAVEAQLGLKLERKKLPLDFLVVEHVEKVPVEN